MRKLFTRFLSVFVLISVFVFQGFAQDFPDLGLTGDFTNHKKTEKFVLTASEAVVPGVGVIRLKSSGGATLAAYQATNANVTIAEGDGVYNITVNFSSFLQEGSDYTLETDANFIKAADDGQASIAKSWAVTVGDYTAPLLAETDPLSPENGETSVELNASLTATFNEDVQIASGGMVYIYEDNGTAFGNLYDVVAAGSGLSASGAVVTINPNKDFEELTKYYVVIPSGAIVDNNTFENDNPFAGWINHTSWAFTTRDVTAPEVTSIEEDNVGATSFDVFTQLDKPGKIYVMAVEKGDVPTAGDFTALNGMKEAEVTAANTDVKVTLTQYLNVGTGASNMVQAVEYDVWIITENAEENNPNQSSPAKKLTVKTADVTAPTVSTRYPLDNATDADINEKNNLVLVLSENAKIGTGSVSVYKYSTSELVVSVPATSLKIGTVGKDSVYIPVDKSLWESETQYFVTYTEGIVTDLAGNKLAAITGNSAWNFTVQDFLAPTYTIVPADGTTDADETAPQVTITFDEVLYSNATGTAMVVGDLTTNAIITLKKGTSSVSYTATLTGGNVIELTINPADVTSKAAFELTIDTKKIFDGSGNVGTTTDKINFSIRDYEGPKITIEPLAPGKSDNILVKFDEPVFNADGSAITNADVANIVIFRKGTSASGAIVSATYTVAADAKSFIIDPTNDFTTPSENYYVRIGAGAVVDALGNPNELTDETLTIKDFIAPTADIYPAEDDSPVNPVALAATITFSEAMFTLGETPTAVSGDATALVNLKEDGENIPFTAAWNTTDVNAPVIEISVPGGDYNYNKTYTISVGKSLEDAAGNLFEGASATFTTWSDEAPKMVSTTPAKDAVEVAVDADVEVTFDQEIIIGGAPTVTVVGSVSGDVTGALTVDGSVLSIEHSDFDENETVTVTVGAGSVHNAFGVNNAAITWSFKTIDTNAPTVSTYSPVVGASDVALNAKLTLTFNEKIVEQTGQIFIKDYATDVTIQTLTEANTVVKDNNKLEITPVADFVYGKQYYVVITEGFVADAAGNDYAGISGNTWNFTAKATPGDFVVSDSNPEDGEDMVDATITTITVEFNRDIKAGSLSSTASIVLTDGTNEIFNDIANTGRFSISGKTLIIQTLGDLEADKTYTLTLEGGVVADNWDTPNTAATITFYTFDNYAPEVVSHTPAEDAEDVAVNTTVTLTWDEMPLNAGTGTTIVAADVYSIVDVNGLGYVATVNGLEWTLTLDADLAEKTTYTVSVDLTKVEDASGNVGTGSYSWSFTTVDTQVNAPSNFVVTENTKGTEIKFTVDFDEKGTVYYVVLPSASTAPAVNDVIAADKKIAFAAAGTSAAQTATGLVSGADYVAYFVAVDEAGNISTLYSAPEFTTADVVAPLVLTMTPANGAVDVDADTDLVLTFDEAVVISGLGHVIIREVATDIIVEDITVTGSNTTLTDDDKTATIERTITLGSETEYYVEISTGTFTDAALNKVAGIFGSDKWAFTTKDTVEPTLVETTPNYAATATPEITADATLSMEFDEGMKVSGVLYVNYMADDAVFEVINASALSLSTDKKTISFNLTNVPAEQTEFYVDLSELTLTDEADNAWTGIELDSKAWNFVILDQTPPALLSSVPADGATGVEIDTDIVLTFTEGVYRESDNADFTATTIKNVISVKDAAGNSVAYTATLTDVDTDGGVVEVTINPTSELESETEYTVYISPVVDDRENVSDEITVSFITKDDTAPAVLAWDPEYDTEFNPQTGVVTVTFTEPIFDDVVTTDEGNPVLVDIVDENIVDFFTYNHITAIVRDSEDEITSWTEGDVIAFSGSISEDNMVITLTPVAAELPLGSEQWYRVVLKPGVVEDAAGNVNVADETIFRIEDHIAPTATYAPQGPAAVDADMVITFDEGVELGTGNLYIRNYANGTLVETIEVNETNVTVDGAVVEIAHEDFPEGMEFYVTADAGAFTDLAGNEWAGIASSAIDTWKFSTADAVEPVLFGENALKPAPGSTNVSLTATLEITFNKKISKGTGWIIIYNEDWTPFQVIDVTSANVTLGAVTSPVYQADRKAIIAHNEFDELSTYYVRVEEGTFVDVASNEFAGILDNSWYFTTEDNSAPILESTNPADDAVSFNVNSNITMTFDRDVLANAAGKIYIYEETGTTGVLVETIDPTDASVVTINGATVTIHAVASLEQNKDYYIIVDEGAFTNTSSSLLPFAGVTTTQEWNFSTGSDSFAPELITWSPVGVIYDNHPVFVMGFNEDVALSEAGGNLVVTAAGAEEPTLVIALTADMFDGDSVVVEYEEGVMLQSNVDYYVTVDADAIEDMLGNAWAGIDDETTWVFSTGVLEYAIAEVQGEGEVSPLVDESVSVTGTVTGVSAGEGFFMQDANAAWSGIWVEYADAADLTIGDGVTVVGVVAEVANVTTITASEVTAAEAPVVVEAIVLDSPSAAEAEMYESVLVQVVGARGTAADEGNGEWTIYYEETDNVIVNDWLFAYSPVADHFFHVTGIVNGRMESYKLEPRMASDIVDVTETTDVKPIPTAEFKVYPNPFNNIINIDNHDKLTRAIVTNIAGQRVLDVEYPDHVISTSNLRSGVYVISLYTEDGMAKSVRIVKR